MSEMVERVARAIAEAERGQDIWDHIEQDGTGYGHLGKEDYRMFARAAIAAMREPTRVMLAAIEYRDPAHGSSAGFEELSGTEAWPVMIDAALTQGPLS